MRPLIIFPGSGEDEGKEKAVHVSLLQSWILGALFYWHPVR
jgi:hypothetical protein